MSIRAAYNSGIIDYAVNGTEKYKEEAKKEESVISKAEDIIKSALNKIDDLEEDDGDDEEEPPIDWEKAKEEAEKEREDDEEIGIGTDGSIVDMSLWRLRRYMY